MKNEEVVKQLKKKEDILRIFNLINSKRIIKTAHFYKRIIMRDLDEKLVDEILPQKEKIKLIDKRLHARDLGYDFYYEISGNRTLKLCFISLEGKTLLINAILRHRRWQNSIRFLGKR